MTQGYLYNWVQGIKTPSWKTREKLERVLDIRPGSLTQFVGKREAAVTSSIKKLWDKRREKAGTVEKRRLRTIAGDYQKGVRPSVALRGPRKPGPRAPWTLRGRIRNALAKVCKPSNNGGRFVACVGCRKALYRPNVFLNNRDVYWHPECKLVSRRQNPTGFHPSKRRGPDITVRVRITLLRDGLGKTSRQIFEKELPGKVFTRNAELSIHQSVRLGRRDLEGLQWGKLFPAVEKRPSNINKVLKDFPVLEVLQISSMQHPLSSVVDVKPIKKWFPTPKEIDPLNGFKVADNPLAKIVAETIRQRFRTVHAAAKSSGMNHKSLQRTVTAPGPHLWNKTLRGISVLTGLPVAELRRLKNAQTLAPTR